MTTLTDHPITKRWPPVREDMIQLYAFPTPNGVKASITLEELGLEVMEAVDGLEALEQYRLHGDEIDLVLLDITMPRLDGYQALRRIRNMDPDARVVLSTGKLQDADEVELEWGVPMLAKPYGSQELRAVLARVLGGAVPAEAETREEVRG